MVEQPVGEEREVLGSVALGAGRQLELVEVKGRAEGGVLDTARGPPDPTLRRGKYSGASDKGISQLKMLAIVP